MFKNENANNVAVIQNVCLGLGRILILTQDFNHYISSRLLFHLKNKGQGESDTRGIVSVDFR